MALLAIVQQPSLIVARIDGVQLSHDLVRVLVASDLPTQQSTPRPASVPAIPEV